MELLIEMYQYNFDFQKPIKHSMAQMKTVAIKLKPFGITPSKPELTLILLANIHYTKEQDWGNEFHGAMSAIRKQYNYNHIHNTTSLVYTLADADELQNMK